MYNLIFIRHQSIGTKDHDPQVLLDAVRELVTSGEIRNVPLVAKYSFMNDGQLNAFTAGLEAAGDLSDFAYVSEDTNSPKFDEQHEVYTKFEELLRDYL